MILFGFYSTNYKFYIRLPCINTQQLTIFSFNITHVISSSDCQTTRLYHGSVNYFVGDRNSCIICLLQPYQTIHYQAYVFIIAIFTNECNVLLLQKNIFKVCVVLFGFFYNIFWNFISIDAALAHSNKQQQHFLCDCHCHGLIYYVDSTKLWF